MHGKHRKSYSRGSDADQNWRQFKAYLQDDVRWERSQRRLAMVEARPAPRMHDMPALIAAMLTYASDDEILRVYNLVEEVAQRRGLMG